MSAEQFSERFPNEHFDSPRSSWGEGPWETEPDRIEWKTEAGLPAIIRRNRLGNLCGYVAVPPGHPAHGKAWDSIPVDAHGGVTYAEPCSGEVCHVPEPGEPDDVWWVGYDCSHAWDLMPAMRAAIKKLMPDQPDELIAGLGTYRDLDYNRGECESLAKQLKEMPDAGG